MRAYLFSVFCFICHFCFSQVGIGTTTPNGALDINSSDQGLIVPRVALTASNVSAPVINPAGGSLLSGTIVYNTATAGTSPNDIVPGFYFWDGAKWLLITTQSSPTKENWSVLGNAGTSSSTNFIGTTDAVDFVTKTNNVERMRVNSAGNVGIGTDAPTNLLHLKKITDTGSGNDGGGLLIETDNPSGTNSYHPSITLTRKVLENADQWLHSINYSGKLNTTGNYGIYSAIRGFINSNVDTSLYFDLRGGMTGADPLSGTLSTILSLRGSGKVGIDTSTPKTTLDVRAKNDNGTTQGAVTASDGILVPRVSSLTVSGTTNGQMVYLVADNGGFFKGFHYWNGTVWSPVTPTNVDWYKSLTTTHASTINDNIYTMGTVSIGKNQENNGILNVYGSAKNTLTLQTSDYTQDYGIAFQNPGGSYTWSLYRHDGGSFTGDLRFAGKSNSINTDINSLVDYVTFKNNGKVGIGNGLTNPTARLDVAAVTRTGTYTYGGSTMYVTGDLGPLFNGAEFLHTNGTAGIGIGWQGLYSIGTAGNNSMHLKSQPGGKIILEPDNGSVGFSIEATSFCPTVDDQIDLGWSAKKFKAVYATNGTIQTSDVRLKKNIRPMKYGLNEVMNLKPVVYDWKNNSGTNKLGFIAQELKEVVPNVVIGDESKENLGVNYAELVPVLTKAIQEQQKIIEELKTRIEKLEKGK